MKIKRLDCRKIVALDVKDATKKRIDLNKVVRINTYAREAFDDVLKKENENVWYKGKLSNRDTVNWLDKKYNILDEVIHTFEGVVISDLAIEEFDKNKIASVEVPKIFGGIENVTEGMKEILELPPKFTLHTRIDMENFQTDLEKSAIKLRWDLMNKDDNKDNIKADEIEKKEFYDDETKVMNFQFKKATDFKLNKRIKIPEPLETNEEVKIGYVKEELTKVVKNYMKNYCDKKGKPKNSNLDSKKEQDLKDLEKKMKEEDLVIFNTDKTGHFTLNTKENYIQSMKKHVEKDKVITEKLVTKAKNEINEHTMHFVDFLQIGKGHGHLKRCRASMNNKHSEIPAVHGTHKDHKEFEDKVKGPDVRVIAGAVVGPNLGLSDIVSDVVEQVTDEKDIEQLCSKSTEEILHAVESYNRSIKDDVDGEKKRKVLASIWML